MSKTFQLELKIILTDEQQQRVVETARRLYSAGSPALQYDDEVERELTPEEFINGPDSALMHLIEENAANRHRSKSLALIRGVAYFRATVTTTDVGRTSEGSLAMPSLRPLNADQPQTHCPRALFISERLLYITVFAGLHNLYTQLGMLMIPVAIITPSISGLFSISSEY